MVEKAKEVKIEKKNGFHIIDEQFIVLTDNNLRANITNITDDYTFQSRDRRIHMGSFRGHIPELKIALKEKRVSHQVVKMLTELLDIVNNGFDYEALVKEHREKGVVSFFLLDFFFEKGRMITWIDEEDNLRCAEVYTTTYGSSWGGEYFQIRARYIKGTGSGFVYAIKTFRIPGFDKTKRLIDLPIQDLKDSDIPKMADRGKVYTEVINNCKYMNYSGTQCRDNGWWGRVYFKADGRLMADIETMRRMDPDYFRQKHDDEVDEGDEEMDSVPENLYHLCDSVVFGFSFNTKMWGEFSVSRLKDIVFDENAFDIMVLDEQVKKMILALVKNQSVSFNDIISGKGGGCIFLLHGPPGTGKTLTAEAVAELLKRPLYSATVGELGVDPDELEKRLRKILEMASTWDAVLLLDEADIFLEARDHHDIHRNAMVGVFLRLLEYHQGVLFLTTNRAKNIDPAMRSRISIALSYPDHVEKTRRHIWENLLSAAQLKNLNVDKLIDHDVNGRQIKNAIRIAQSLALEEKVAINEDHILKSIELSEQFEKDMAKKD